MRFYTKYFNFLILFLSFICYILIFLSHAYAQSINTQAPEVFDLIENLYPEILSPQATFLENIEDLTLEEIATYLRDANKDLRVLYRSYKDFDVKTDHYNLYLYDHENNLSNIGPIGYWLPFFKSEILFNWLEKEYPSLLSPQPQNTQSEDTIFYRSYPDTNITIGTYENDLYVLDKEGVFSDDPPALYNIGPLDHWIRDKVMKNFQYTLGGVYTIHNKHSRKSLSLELGICRPYQCANCTTALDAYKDWKLAKFKITPLGSHHYKIQPYDFPNSDLYYLYGSKHASRNYRVIFMGADWGDAVTWIISKLPTGKNEYKIQQKSSGRYLYDSPKNGPVTIGSDWGDSITWIIEHNPYDVVLNNDNPSEKLYPDSIVRNHEFSNNDMEQYSIDYIFDQNIIHDISLVNRACVSSPDQYASTISITYKQRHTETSFFQNTYGYQITLGTEISIGIPQISGGASLSFELSEEKSITWGQEESTSKEWEISNSIEVNPGSKIRLCGYINEIDISIPYVMLFKSKSTGVFHQSKGMWRGKLGTDVIFETHSIENNPISSEF